MLTCCVSPSMPDSSLVPSLSSPKTIASMVINNGQLPFGLRGRR